MSGLAHADFDMSRVLEKMRVRSERPFGNAGCHIRNPVQHGCQSISWPFEHDRASLYHAITPMQLQRAAANHTVCTAKLLVTILLTSLCSLVYQTHTELQCKQKQGGVQHHSAAMLIR